MARDLHGKATLEPRWAQSGPETRGRGNASEGKAREEGWRDPDGGHHVLQVQLIACDNQCQSMVPNKPGTWIRDTTTYKPIVAANDMTISRNIAFVKRSLNVAPRSSASDTCLHAFDCQEHRSKLDSLHLQTTRSYTNLDRSNILSCRG